MVKIIWSQKFFINDPNNPYIFEGSENIINIPTISGVNKIIDNADNIINKPKMAGLKKDIDITDNSQKLLD